MIRIIKATLNDVALIIEIGKTAFLEAHGSSAPVADIEAYVNHNFTEIAFAEALQEKHTIFNIIYYNDIAVGYSKIIINEEHPNISNKKVSKLERLYVLKTYHNLKLGFELFNYNLNISKNNNQSGIWLFVWTENHKAINFYKKLGFEVIGNHQFQISETHSNPNHQMLLTF